jgi:nitrite reductase (cytochrome c-552)
MIMSTPNQSSSRWLARCVYLGVLLITAGLAVAVTYLLTNIQDRKHEALQHYFKLEDLSEDSIDPKLCKKNFDTSR